MAPGRAQPRLPGTRGLRLRPRLDEPARVSLQRPLLRAENAHDKEYLVTVDKPLSERFAKRMAKGVPILGTVTKPCKVQLKSAKTFSITLTQGLNRQIRRMCEYLGYDVVKLKRIRIMHLDLSGLKPGQWRLLSDDELSRLQQAVAQSQKHVN